MLMKRGRHSKFASNQKSPLIHPSPWVSFTNAGTPLLRHAPPQQNYPPPPPPRVNKSFSICIIRRRYVLPM